jgi:DNA-binding transcriptional regulator YbjK
VDTRDERLLDAAIEVVGTGGMRRLTHRAVDAAAGLPMGSTSNRFRTRDALLVGVLRRILERETAAWTRLAGEIRIVSVDAFATVVGRLMTEQTGAGRVLAQARRALFVEAVNHPALGDEITRAQRELASWMAPILADLGSATPSRHVPHLLALMDGLVGNQLATNRADFDPAAAVAALVRGLVDAAPRPRA